MENRPNTILLDIAAGMVGGATVVSAFMQADDFVGRKAKEAELAKTERIGKQFSVMKIQKAMNEGRIPKETASSMVADLGFKPELALEQSIFRELSPPPTPSPPRRSELRPPQKIASLFSRKTACMSLRPQHYQVTPPPYNYTPQHNRIIGWGSGFLIFVSITGLYVIIINRVRRTEWYQKYIGRFNTLSLVRRIDQLELIQKKILKDQELAVQNQNKILDDQTKVLACQEEMNQRQDKIYELLLSLKNETN